MTKKTHRSEPAAIVVMQYRDFTETTTICWSPGRAVEVVRVAEDQGLSVKSVVWAADGSVMLSEASVPDFLAQKYEYQLGWMNTMWAAMLQSSIQLRPAEGVKRVTAGAGECRWCKVLMHWVMIPLIAAVLAAICLDQAASHFNSSKLIPASQSHPPDPN